VGPSGVRTGDIPSRVLVNDADYANCDPRSRQNAEKDHASSSTAEATLPAGDVPVHALWVRVDIEGSGRIEALTNQGIDVPHCVLPGVLSTVSAARRVPRALWRAFFTALSPMPSASPTELMD